MPFLHEAIEKVKSQKAKGVLNLAYQSQCGLLSHPFGLNRPAATIYPHAYRGDFELFLGQVGLFKESSYFARPCPVRPRHGFVESRELKGFPPLRNLYEETTRIEPEGEILVMPVYSGRVSAVATQTGVAWGKGNDGATAGKGAINIPTPSVTPIWDKLFNRGQMGLQQNAFLEIVEHMNNSMLVQVRDGPAIPGTKNFIPPWAAMDKVRKILVTDDLRDDDNESLLKWERICETAVEANGGPEGIAVFIPYHTLGSHYAVHGIVNGMAVITEEVYRPVVGEFLNAPISNIGKLEDRDLIVIRDLIDGTRHYNINSDAGWLVRQAIASLHSSSLWDNSSPFLKLRASMIVTVARALAAACIGEDRYFFGNGPGSSSGSNDEPCGDRNCEICAKLREKPQYKPRQPHVKRYQNRGVCYSREMAYEEMFSTPWHGLNDEVTDAYKDFKMPGWRSSFGGRNWANCAEATLKLIKRVDKFLTKPNQYNWKLVMSATNQGVNVVHNSGACLTKWVDKSAMNVLAACPVTGFLSQITPKTLGV